MTMRDGLALTVADDIHRMLLGLTLLDGVLQLAAEIEECLACGPGRPCERHWPAEAAWTSYEHARDLIEAQTGQPPGPAGTAVTVMVRAAVGSAAAARRRHPLDAVLTAAYDALARAVL